LLNGNAESFLKLWPWENLASAYIIGKVISNIKDFYIQSTYLEKYANYACCWALTDAIKIKITPENEKEYWDILCKYLKSNHIFKRRLGVILMFGYIQKEEYIHKIFLNVQNLYEEREYYVNMALAWLLCECFVKQRNITLEYLENGIANTFVTNKCISKCRDSFRVSLEDKQLLLNYKKR
jgi:3-methyladenine DNA glycosylase AlkD